MKENIWGAGAGLHGYTPGWKAVYLSMGQWVFAANGKSLGYADDAIATLAEAGVVRLGGEG